MSEASKPKKEFNNLCAKCQRNCKQLAKTLLIECRQFLPVPRQLEFKFNKKSKK